MKAGVSLSKVETLSELAPAAKVDAKDLGFNVEKTETHYVPQHPHFVVTGTGGAFQISAPEAPRWDRSLMNGGTYKLSWVSGRHNLKLGYEDLYRHWRTLRQHGGTAGNFGHNGQSTRRLSDGAGGLGMADFLLGRPSSYNQATAFDKNDYSPLHTIFMQDDLRMNRLTINFGLRYEIEVPWKIVENRGATFVRGQKSERYPQAPTGLVYLGDQGIPDTMIPVQQRVLPRVGFALDVRGNGRTALRGGYGKFGYTQGAIVPSQNNELPPFHPIVNLNDPYSLTDPWGPNRTSPFPYVRNDEGEGLFPTTPIPMQVLDTRWRSGYTHQFNVTFQQQLGEQVVVSAGYVGSRARNMSRRGKPQLGGLHPGGIDGSEYRFASAAPAIRERGYSHLRSRVVDGLQLAAGHGDEAVREQLHPADDLHTGPFPRRWDGRQRIGLDCGPGPEQPGGRLRSVEQRPDARAAAQRDV